MNKILVILLFLTTVSLSYERATENKRVSKLLRGDYGPAFDEITVNSSLNIRKKNQTRTARSPQHHHHKNQNSNQFPASFPKFPDFPGISGGASASGAQAQAFNAFGPIANFGASSTGTNTQGFSVGPGGISGSAGISGSQQYNLPNGETVDIAFGNTFSGAGSGGSKGSANSQGAAISITGPDGKTRPLN